MIKRKKILFVLLVFSFLFAGMPALAENDLKDTMELVDSAKNNFKTGSISISQEKIYISNYLSGLKKAIAFANNLHIYVHYEKSISIENDRRLYQCRMKSAAKICSQEDKERIKKEINILKANAEDDVETFLDHIRDGLYLCDAVEADAGERIYHDKSFNKTINGYLKKNDQAKTLESKQNVLVSDDRFKDAITVLFIEIDKWEASIEESRNSSKPRVPDSTINKL